MSTPQNQNTPQDPNQGEAQLSPTQQVVDFATRRIIGYAGPPTEPHQHTSSKYSVAVLPEPELMTPTSVEFYQEGSDEGDVSTGIRTEVDLGDGHLLEVRLWHDTEPSPYGAPADSEGRFVLFFGKDGYEQALSAQGALDFTKRIETLEQAGRVTLATQPSAPETPPAEPSA